jgi:hypothetical protein
MNLKNTSGSPTAPRACPNRGSKSPFRHSRRQRVNLQNRPNRAAGGLCTFPALQGRRSLLATSHSPHLNSPWRASIGGNKFEVGLGSQPTNFGVNLQTVPTRASAELRTSVFLLLGVHNGRPVLNLILLCSMAILSMPSIQSIYLRFTFPCISSTPSLPPFPIRTLHSALCTLQLVFPPYIGDYRELSAFIFPPKTTQKTNH